jgi:D-alanyl-lipoteichoic acid acyltransferase DltB (MBOAT superfamily)
MERCAIAALIILSLFFYGWWNPVYLLLLVPLTLTNFILGRSIILAKSQRPNFAKSVLIIGLIINIGVLGYFKYANFFIDNMNSLFGLDLFLAQIVLPLGISFFTFQKIAFLVDAYRGKIEHLNLLDFSLFVSFFPQLIAGPIVHHSEVLPQLRQKIIKGEYIAMGISIFIIGLAKKILLADNAALYSTPAFNEVAKGQSLDFFTAWSAAFAYTAQLYFDFSGYCDMAIGAALLFGIRLPVNFNSPYKATSIIDFWRRWHITLSRFLRDYLYIPLGGNRHGKMRRYANLFITMLLGGLWHGASWTFVAWGGLHGIYLAVNHAWRNLRLQIEWFNKTTASGVFLGQALTFLAVVIAWVFFRSADTQSAFSMLNSMSGNNGFISAINIELLAPLGFLLIAWIMPNTQEIMGYIGPDSIYGKQEAPRKNKVNWQPALPWAILLGSLFAISVMSFSKISEFIYFQF